MVSFVTGSPGAVQVQLTCGLLEGIVCWDGLSCPGLLSMIRIEELKKEPAFSYSNCNIVVEV